MVKKFGKSWVLLICQIELVTLLTDGILAHLFAPERLSDSTLIICLVAAKFFLPLKSWS